MCVVFRKNNSLPGCMCSWGRKPPKVGHWGQARGEPQSAGACGSPALSPRGSVSCVCLGWFVGMVVLLFVWGFFFPS